MFFPLPSNLRWRLCFCRTEKSLVTMKLLNSYQTTASRKLFDYWVVLGTSKGWFVRLSSLFFLFFIFIYRKEKFKQHIIPGTLQISLKTYNEGITSKLLYKNWTLRSQNYPRKKVSHIALEPLRVLDSYTQPVLLFIVLVASGQGGRKIKKNIRFWELKGS